MIDVIQIEQAVFRLPKKDQLWLLERIAHNIREHENESKSTLIERQLSAMANDPEIQNELKNIAIDFENTEFDGLE